MFKTSVYLDLSPGFIFQKLQLCNTCTLYMKANKRGKQNPDQMTRTHSEITADARGISAAYTVNSEIFARISFSRIASKDIFSMLKIRDFGMIYLHQKMTKRFSHSRGSYFRETSRKRSFAKIKPSRKFSNLQYIVGVLCREKNPKPLL